MSELTTEESLQNIPEHEFIIPWEDAPEGYDFWVHKCGEDISTGAFHFKTGHRYEDAVGFYYNIYSNLVVHKRHQGTTDTKGFGAVEDLCQEDTLGKSRSEITPSSEDSPSLELPIKYIITLAKALKQEITITPEGTFETEKFCKNLSLTEDPLEFSSLQELEDYVECVKKLREYK